jgi:hypothetical protein
MTLAPIPGSAGTCSGPERARALIRDAGFCRADGAETDDDLVSVGAGPLEDLLVRHGGSLIDEVDDFARRNPRFAATMSGV